MGDQTPLILDALIRQGSHFTPFLEPRFGILRLALDQNLVLHSLRHAIEGGTDGVGFMARELWQAEGKIPLLNSLETLRNDREGLQSALYCPKCEPIRNHEHDGRDG